MGFRYINRNKKAIAFLLLLFLLVFHLPNHNKLKINQLTDKDKHTHRRSQIIWRQITVLRDGTIYDYINRNKMITKAILALVCPHNTPRA